MYNTDQVLPLLKARLGISSTVRDEYLVGIINGVMSDMENIHGIKIDLDKRPDHLMFIVDYSSFRYSNVSLNSTLPNHLYARLKNMMIGDRK